MTLRLVIPRDPLIFRDGKPFTAVPGERSKSLLFPFPATLAGAVRTREGSDPTTGEFKKTKAELDELKRLSIRGPILVELDTTGNIKDWFFPAPADALLVMKNNIPTQYFLSPLDVEKDRLSNLDEGLYLIGPSELVKDKPMLKPPLYWTRVMMEQWLKDPVNGAVDLDTLGIQGPQRETRTHVSIVPETQSALSGALFQTSGMEFIQSKREEDVPLKLKDARTLALALETAASFASGMGFLGGERRVVRWENIEGELPSCPEEIKARIIKERRCRLILVTPAYFESDKSRDEQKKGFIPARFKEYVRAVALPRYQTISGWDYEINKPKPTRRLVPAGSVYFLSLENVEDIGRLVDDVWLKSVSDDEQSRADGFGIALLGTWNGQPRKMNMEVKHE